MRFKNISMNVWLIFAWELQTNLIIKEDANAVNSFIPDSPSLFWKLYPFMETISGKKTFKLLIGFQITS